MESPTSPYCFLIKKAKDKAVQRSESTSLFKQTCAHSIIKIKRLFQELQSNTPSPLPPRDSLTMITTGRWCQPMSSNILSSGASKRWQNRLVDSHSWPYKHSQGAKVRFLHRVTPLRTHIRLIVGALSVVNVAILVAQIKLDTKKVPKELLVPCSLRTNTQKLLKKNFNFLEGRICNLDGDLPSKISGKKICSLICWCLTKVGRQNFNSNKSGKTIMLLSM